jgi:murein DD-endopeptidase MepM/ murein hydrolase activator NlpD
MSLKRIAALGALIILSSCSHFQGPGGYHAQGEAIARDTQPVDGEDESSGPGPKISWSGERRFSKPNEPFQFDWPLDQARLSRGFMIGGKKSHWGLDLANKKGTNILAAERGVVIYTGKGFHGYGNLVVIEHGDEWATLYAHLSEIDVKEGDTVTRGQEIGKMGRTGHATGSHLHFEMRHNRQPVNPMAYLPEGF